MTEILDEVLAASAKYAESFGDKGNLALPRSRHFAILTCMDARLDPAKYAGLAEGDGAYPPYSGSAGYGDPRDLGVAPLPPSPGYGYQSPPSYPPFSFPDYRS